MRESQRSVTTKQETKTKPKRVNNKLLVNGPIHPVPYIIELVSDLIHIGLHSFL